MLIPENIKEGVTILGVTGTYGTKYDLTVENGTGSGEYHEGTPVPVTFVAPEDAYNPTFSGWTGDTSGLLLGDGSAFDPMNGETQTVIMPAKDITLTGTHTGTFMLTVADAHIYKDGTAMGTSARFKEGELITVKALSYVGKEFVNWEGDIEYIPDITASEIEITMPAKAITLTATHKTLEPVVTVIGGETSGTYQIGDVVPIYWTPPEDDGKYEFSYWSGDASESLKLEDGSSFDRYTGGTAEEPQMIVIPNNYAEITLTANYSELHYLTVNNAEGSGWYRVGQGVTLSAVEEDGYEFVEWQGDIDCLSQPTWQNTYCTIPDRDITITAVFEATTPVEPVTYTLQVDNGTPSGSYAAGETITIEAMTPPDGYEFDQWYTNVGLTDEQIYSSTITITMPAYDATFSAAFKPISE